jgi:Inner membrane component of T3SS, cytoplasmic domain
MNTNFSENNVNSVFETLCAVIVSGRHCGAQLEVRIPLLKNLLIGSHLDCDLVISDDGVTSLHAMLFEQHGCIWAKSLPGCGEMLVDGDTVNQTPVRLVDGMVLKLGSIAMLRIESSSLPRPKLAKVGVAGSSQKFSQRLHKIRTVASLVCITCSVVLMALSLNAGPALSSANASVVQETSAEPTGHTSELRNTDLLEAAARQVDRYLADPGVKVQARFPKQIEVSGVARSATTRAQLEKIQKALPPGVEISSTVSYPLDKVNKTAPAVQEQQISKLAKKILQVASSERVPYVEIEGGARIFEGGQLNGYELVKISPNAIVAKRDNQTETFRVE